MSEQSAFSLLSGEEYLTSAEECIKASLCHPYGPEDNGNLHCTNHRICLTDVHNQIKFHLDLGMISKIEKIQVKSIEQCRLCITCRDMQDVYIELDSRHRMLIEKLKEAPFPLSNKENMFAFTHWEKQLPDPGWNIYNPKDELMRLGIPGHAWQITNINSNYKFAPTYPAVLAVPDSADNSLLENVGSFRSKQRIPVLSWLNRQTGASLTRCSQALGGGKNMVISKGLSFKRNSHDEMYLKKIMESNASQPNGHVFDARPYKNALANIALGGSYELTTNYSNITSVSFMGIHNIHVMRQSFMKLKEYVYPIIDDTNWLKNLEDTHWMEYLKLILHCTVRIVKMINADKTSVLVHCTDGWDRTSQLTALAMLMLDPFYRTIEGFIILIEKEWLSFGHMFQTRLGVGDKNSNNQNRSPVFVQFIDCVYQLLEQFSNAFQFNEQFLIAILNNIYSNRFGTFLYDCERQRIAKELNKKTASLWTFLLNNEEMYSNPFYNKENTGELVLIPVVSMRKMKFWKGYYFQHNPHFVKQFPFTKTNLELLKYRKFMTAKDMLV